MTTTLTIVKRLIVVVVTLNVMVLALLAVVMLTSDNDDSAEAAADEAGSTTTTPASTSTTEVTTTTTTTTTMLAEIQPPPAVEPPLPVAYPPVFPDPFEPTTNEVQPEAKRLATAVAYAITNYDVDDTLSDVLAKLASVPDEMADQTAAEVRVVHHAGMWSRGIVEYAQMGGHLNDRISIMVVIRQEIGADGGGEPEQVETRTMDIRLERDGGGPWSLETIASAGGQPIARPADLSPEAAAVVDHALIDLPDSGVWDIYAGRIDRQLLQVMLDLAERTNFSVVVFQTGHPHNVFGTDRVSNHTVGRAVDIYKLGSELVIDAHDPSSGTYALSEWVVSRYDIREFGSPWKFPDAVAHTFTNQIHHDHLHIGARSYPSSPEPPPS